jgi:hypothetical protein
MRRLFELYIAPVNALTTPVGICLSLLIIFSLLGGAYGTFALTEAGQVIDMPRDWFVFAFKYRYYLSIFLVIVFLLVLGLQPVKQTFRPFFLIIYSLLVAACVFFIHFFAPEVWLRSEHHTASFMSVEDADARLSDDADIFVLVINGDARAYPRDWMQLPHIAGDEVGGEDTVMTYCALSNLPLAFNPVINGKETDFRVIAQVNNNLVFADKNSGELVQQITGLTEFSHTLMHQYPVQRMPWQSLKDLYPDAMVFDYSPTMLDELSMKLFNVTLASHYEGDPLFPTLDLKDHRLDNGEQIWGLKINDEQLAVTRSAFEKKAQWRVRLGGRDLVVVWYPQYETVGSYHIDGVTDSDSPLTIDPYGVMEGKMLDRSVLYSQVSWMVWSHWFPDTKLIQ